MKKDDLPKMPLYKRREKRFQRIQELEHGYHEYGLDFFMVDPRPLGKRQKAAPFHIECQQDGIFFIEQGSPLIDWKALSIPFINMMENEATSNKKGS